MVLPDQLGRDVVVEVGFERQLAALAVAPPRLVERALERHLVVDEVRNHLDVALRLHVPAHHAERGPVVLVEPDDARDERVERPLAGFEAVRVIGVQREGRAPVLERDARVARDQPGAEAGEPRVDVRDDVALVVGDGEEDGVGVLGVRVRHAEGDVVRGGLADAGGALGRPLARRQRRNRLVFGVGDVAVAVVEGSLQCLSKVVNALGRVVVVLARAQFGRNVERLQGDEPLVVRRELVHRGAVVGSRHGVGPLDLEVREVVDGHEPALRLDLVGDRLGDLALVDDVGALLGDSLHRLGEPRERHRLADCRRLAVEQERLPGVVVGEQGVGAGPVGGDDLRDGVPIGRVPDRRGERVREAQPTQPLDGRLPAAGRPRDRDRVRAVEGHPGLAGVVDRVAAVVGVVGVRVVVLGERRLDVLDRRVRGGAAARAHRADLAVGGPVQREHVAPEPGRGGLDDVERGRGRDRRVERVAAFAEDLYPRLARERLTGRHHAAPAVHGGPSRRESV